MAGPGANAAPASALAADIDRMPASRRRLGRLAARPSASALARRIFRRHDGMEMDVSRISGP
jgi:hypothetical protein